MSKFKNKNLVEFGVSCYSMHPLKNLNVWGDGGVVVSNDVKFINKIKLLRNHGLIDRENSSVFSYNSRLILFRQ